MLVELPLVPAFDEIADEHENRLRGLRDEALAIGDRAMDDRPAAELCAEENVHWVGELFGHVHNAVSKNTGDVRTARIDAITAAITSE
jgi:hypothetical protein